MDCNVSKKDDGPVAQACGIPQQSSETSPSKINGDRSPARIIASKQNSLVDNNSQVSVPLGFVNPEGEDPSKKNVETSKTEDLLTAAPIPEEALEEKQNSQILN